MQLTKKGKNPSLDGLFISLIFDDPVWSVEGSEMNDEKSNEKRTKSFGGKKVRPYSEWMDLYPPWQICQLTVNKAWETLYTVIEI